MPLSGFHLRNSGSFVVDYVTVTKRRVLGWQFVSIREDWPYLIAFALSAVLLVVLFLPLTSTEPYGYDSADYMYAGTRGFWRNYTDAGTLSLQQFVAQGLEARKHPDKKAELSKLIRTNDDIAFYRHFHGPVYAYWIAFWTALGVSDEAGYRNT